MDFTKTLSNQVLTYDKSLTLKRLGFEKPGHFFWGLISHGDAFKRHLMSRTVFDGMVAQDVVAVQLGDEECFAYTAEELSNAIPKVISYGNCDFYPFIEKNEWHGHADAFFAYYKNTRKKHKLFFAYGHTLVECLGNLMIEYYLNYRKKSNQR